MIFIIGTDTGVGKTHYGKGLIKEGFKVIKPIETGLEDFDQVEASDSYTYAKLAKMPIEDINLYFFNKPASPHLASEMDGQTIDLNLLTDFIDRSNADYVELAGGLMVPITRDFNQLDLIKSFPGAKVDLVVGNKLGCINHALLTIKVLEVEQIAINKIFINTINRTFISDDNEKVILQALEKRC